MMNKLSVFLFYICLKVVYTECPIQCFCYKWRGMTRTDCVKKNLYNTFIKIPMNTEILDLSYNVISILHGNEFQDANLRKLKDLNLSNNRLCRIDKLSFNGLEYLENLDLSYNSLEYINPFTFSFNPNLKILNISYNFIKVQTNESFLSTAPSLHILNMAHCNLRHITFSLFKNLENLKMLNISNNYILKIYPESLETLKNLKYLDFSMNDLMCNNQATLLLQWLRNRKIQFTPFCQVKGQTPINAQYNIEDHSLKMVNLLNNSYANSNINLSAPLKEETVFNDFSHLSKSIPSIYAIILGLHVGICIGAFSTYICIKKRTKMPTVAWRTPSLNVNPRLSSEEESLTFSDNERHNFTAGLIPLNVPPGTPPSPYHSRLILS